MNDADPFQIIAGVWLKKIKLASDHKRKHFGKNAAECMRFFNGPYQMAASGGNPDKLDIAFMFPQGGSDDVSPTVAICVNKASECVQLFGPVLYHRNPDRKVNPRKPVMMPIQLFGDPNDPNVQQMYAQAIQAPSQQQSAIDVTRATLLEAYLNYTPTALNLKRESRMTIDEAIIKGAGVLWCETYDAGGFKMVGNFYDTIDNLRLDPDAERREDCKWVARRRFQPVWEVEQKFGLPPGTLEAHEESHSQMAAVDQTKDGDYNRRRGDTNDIVKYWEIWSKMGMGGNLKGIDEAAKEADVFGPYIYLAVCEGYECPLNIPHGMEEIEEIAPRVKWQAPFWADDDWPFSLLAFHEVPRSIWPMSHLKPAMGELRFINWVYSFLATKIKQAIKDKMVCWKGLAEEVKRALTSGDDYALIEVTKEAGLNPSDIVAYLQHPEFQKDIWTVLQAVENNFAMRTGLSELMYGMSSTQLRSAQEASLKGDQLRIRPDDMANKVEDFMTEVARKEALMARWVLGPEDIQPIMGPTAAGMWERLVSPANPTEILHQLEYRIEAGSIRKPNRDKEVADANAAMQTLMPVLTPWAQATGDIGPVNAIITQWCKASMIEPGPFLMSPPPQPEQSGPNPAEIEAQAKMQEMQMDAMSHDQEMRQDEEMHKQEIKQGKEKAKADLANIRAKKSVIKAGSNGSK